MSATSPGGGNGGPGQPGQGTNPAAAVQLSSTPKALPRLKLTTDEEMVKREREAWDEAHSGGSGDEQPSATAALVRDSAIVLGAITAVLYLTNHVIGVQYLRIFGVGAGIHGVGLSQLSLLPLEGYVGLIIGSSTMVTVMLWGRPWAGYLVAAGLIGIGCVPWVFVSRAGVPAGVEPYMQAVVATFQAGLVLGSTYLMRWVRAGDVESDREDNKRYVEGKERRTRAALEVRASEVMDEHEKEEELLQAMDERQRSRHRLARKLEERYLDKEIEQSKTRTKRRKNRLALSQFHTNLMFAYVAAITAALVILPALAWVEATAAIQSEWRATASNEYRRTPVYWADGKVVYLTRESRECFVNVQIDGVLQAKRNCSPLVDAYLR